MGSDRTKKKVLLAAFFIACMISFEFAECMLVRQADQLRGILRQIRSNNILFYLVMLFLFFLVFLGMRAVSVYIGWEAYPERKYVLEKKKQAVIVAVLVAGVLGVLADWFFNVQAHEFPYNALSTWLICVIPKNAAAALILTGMAAVLFMLIKKADLPNGCLYAAYVFTLIINFFCMYFVNIFKTDLYHGIAVLESIYNVCDLVPYSEVTTGIYGHYALFFYCRCVCLEVASIWQQACLLLQDVLRVLRRCMSYMYTCRQTGCAWYSPVPADLKCLYFADLLIIS